MQKDRKKITKVSKYILRGLAFRAIQVEIYRRCVVVSMEGKNHD